MKKIVSLISLMLLTMLLCGSALAGTAKVITMDTSNAPDSVYPTNVVRRKDLVCMRHPIMYDVIVDPKAPVYDFFK